ncbi:MAG: sterol desaturase family protein [Anaerolineales bacterium]|nr:sterol desaturase family protein [Anaerolineales bacterium]
MSNQLFLILFLGIPVVFVALDLLDRHMTRHDRHDGASPRAETLLFLLAVLAIYAGLQFGGLALVPSAETLLVDLRRQFSQWLGWPIDPQSIGGGWLVIISILTFYLSGLWDYALHRWFSHSRPFWWSHEYHHLPNQVFVAMPGLAVRPFVVITSFPATFATVVSAYGLLLLFGLPLWDLTPLKILLLAHTFLLVASHSSFLRRFWWVHHAMKWLALTTPQEHLLHHTVDLNGNYGNFTILWDRVFGTYLDPTLAENQNHPLGLGYDQDFLGTITLGQLKMPEWMRERFQVARYCNIEAEAKAEAELT